MGLTPETAWPRAHLTGQCSERGAPLRASPELPQATGRKVPPQKVPGPWLAGGAQLIPRAGREATLFLLSGGPSRGPCYSGDRALIKLLALQGWTGSVWPGPVVGLEGAREDGAFGQSVSDLVSGEGTPAPLSHFVQKRGGRRGPPRTALGRRGHPLGQSPLSPAPAPPGRELLPRAGRGGAPRGRGQPGPYRTRGPAAGAAAAARP